MTRDSCPRSLARSKLWSMFDEYVDRFVDSIEESVARESSDIVMGLEEIKKHIPEGRDNAVTAYIKCEDPSFDWKWESVGLFYLSGSDEDRYTLTRIKNLHDMFVYDEMITSNLDNICEIVVLSRKDWTS